MVKNKSKKQTKRKKAQKESSIRTDVWQLVMTHEQRQSAILTIDEYRYFLKPLILISYWNWEKLSQLTSTERVNTLEKLIHKTTHNPNPKYHWYFQKAISNHPSFRKFPSYLRRAAIQDALGIVSSFITHWDIWNRGERKHRYDKPPKLTTMCNSYPALYKGQQVKYHSNVELTLQKFSELGGKVSKVNAKYTSAYAFDGSGKIKRSNKNYSQAVFQNGKQYNADLSASYNIGARYWYAILTNSRFIRVWEGKSSCQTLRTPVTLNTLWCLSKA